MTALSRLTLAFTLALLGIGTASAHPEHSSTTIGAVVHAMLAPDHGLPFVLGVVCVVAILWMRRAPAARRTPALIAISGATVLAIGWMAATLL